MGEGKHGTWARRALHAVRAWLARHLPGQAQEQAQDGPRAPQPATLLQTVQVGDIVEGPVHKMAEHWALVDLGAVSGLLHIQDMAWQYVEHAREVLHIGQHVRARVLEVDAGAQRIRLGLKQLQTDPWQGAAQRWPKGRHVQGRVVHIGDTGVLLELEPGLQGRIHQTEIDWADKAPDLHARFAVGETVQALVSKISESTRRLELSTRLLALNPWSGTAQRYPAGTRVRGRVTSVLHSSAFIALEPALEGLLPASEMSWRKKINPRELLSTDDEVDCLVLDVDEVAQRLVLSTKRLLPDPWQDAAQRYPAGTRLRGTVRRLEAYGLFVEINPGLEGLLPLGEIDWGDWDEKSPADAALHTRFAAGQAIDVLVVHLDSDKRHLVLSTREPACAAGWTGAAQRWPQGTRLRARVRHVLPGYGAFAEIAPGVSGRVPALAIARHKARLAVGETIDVQVFKMEEACRHLVLRLAPPPASAQAQEAAQAAAAARLQTLRDGDIVCGVVKHLTDYGAFVDLGGIDALLHTTQMAWKRVRHPREVVHVGMEVTAQVIKLDVERQRVWLGLKQMAGDDPWQGVARRYPPGTRLRGTIVNVVDYGVFVEIETGVEGLVHASSLKLPKKSPQLQARFTPGQSVEVVVLEMDEDKRRIALDMPQPNPWPAFAQNLRCGDTVRGPVQSITNFGLFIGLTEDIDGLVHVSDLSWDDKGAAAMKNYQKGQEVEAVVLAVDMERERIALGIKQLTAAPPQD